MIRIRVLTKAALSYFAAIAWRTKLLTAPDFDLPKHLQFSPWVLSYFYWLHGRTQGSQMESILQRYDARWLLSFVVKDIAASLSILHRCCGAFSRSSLPEWLCCSLDARFFRFLAPLHSLFSCAWMQISGIDTLLRYCSFAVTNWMCDGFSLEIGWKWACEIVDPETFYVRNYFESSNISCRIIWYSNLHRTNYRSVLSLDVRWLTPWNGEVGYAPVSRMNSSRKKQWLPTLTDTICLRDYTRYICQL